MLTNSNCSGFFIVMLSFIFNLLLVLQASSPYRRFVHLQLQMTWFEAQKHCREHYVDLATFRTRNEIQAVHLRCRLASLCWIGLQRDENYPGVWNWSDGERSSIRNWNKDYKQPTDVPGNDNCAAMGGTYWFSGFCDQKLDFMCYDNLILVKENKTWEEALEHCISLDTDNNSRKSYFNHRYILPHMDFRGKNLDARQAVLDAQTQEVWIGLRFLAGHWLWVNGMPLQEQLPLCPAPWRYCGAMAKTGQLLPEMDCLERRNFVCSV